MQGNLVRLIPSPLISTLDILSNLGIESNYFKQLEQTTMWRIPVKANYDFIPT